MNLPHQYPYNSSWTIIAWPIGAGLVWIVLTYFDCHCQSMSYSYAFGCVPIFLGALLALRRVAFKRFLVLKEDALLLPTGFLQFQLREIPYASIKRVRLFPSSSMLVLHTFTDADPFNILLLDTYSCVALDDFLTSRISTPQKKIAKSLSAVDGATHQALPAMARGEFMSKKLESERRIQWRVIPLGIIYALRITAAIGSICLTGAIVWLLGIGVPSVLMYELGFCIFLLCVTYIAESDSKKNFSALSFKCPACQWPLVFIDHDIDAKMMMETGRCYHCDERVFDVVDQTDLCSVEESS